VEQTCYYPDLDDKDRHPDTVHLLAYQDGSIKAYLRALAPSVSYPNHSSIGRVIVLPETRGTRLGHELMKRGNQITDTSWSNNYCKISAQSHLQGFYTQHGFVTQGDEYLEDDIPHVAMERIAK
jgi:ElaA protein